MKVVYKNKQTGLYFVRDFGIGDTDKLELATVSSDKTKWSYEFYQKYEPCLYSDEVKLLRKEKLKKINELNKRLGNIERLKFERYIK